MDKIKIGILGTSDIAFRRFLPALKSNGNFEYVGLAVANDDEWSTKMGDSEYENHLEKRKKRINDFCMDFGGKVFDGYERLLKSDEIEAVYIPLPPALHYKWAAIALESGKNVLLEKPFTTNLTETRELIDIARKNNLAIHENYAFCFHKQIKEIQKLIDSGEIGELRHIRSSFGFPYRGAEDFRYDKELGGGALLDCGGYTLKIASLLLGKSAKITTAVLNNAKGHDVDIFGSATLMNDDFITAQVSFGMDNSYKCELEVWGSEGCIFAPRIFTPTANMKLILSIKNKNETNLEIPMDDQFVGSLNHFYKCICDDSIKFDNFEEVEKQSKLVEDVRKLNEKNIIHN
ncbi:Gfo/Idh/MocA family protein [Trichococcus shcherbakoviae]|uniref:Gfo/Idh/MocA family protein n=1 Tax=Trichococcus shcherbakoviae TaxID=2094020 RepID=UPI002AA5F39D|nr:Gfo/Idh/MocA family oxidoreductase [Trichococcus shcherbakoviae]